MTLSEELSWRGFINQTTLSNLTDIDTEKRTFYFGVDPSDSSMTIGNLATAVMVRHFIQGGHRAILLVGGATGLIGDPKDTAERQLKSVEEVESYKSGIIQQYHRIFDGLDFEIVDNYEWFKEIGYLSFLRDVGKHFSMTQLLDREFVKARIGEGKSGLSYAEFSYSLIQGYDFLHLYRTKNASLQVCGADQWGNALAGVELIRKLEQAEAHVWSAPLIINSATGVKFGKSEDGAVWLDENRTTPYQFYQFWLNVDDQAVKDYLKIYTSIQKDEYDQLIAQFEADKQSRVAQRYLADSVTALIHGEERLSSVKKVVDVLFGSEALKSLSDDEIKLLSNEVPAVNTGGNILDILVEAKLTSSKGEARQLVSSGAVQVNGSKITDESTVVDEMSIIKRGKNRIALVR